MGRKGAIMRSLAVYVPPATTRPRADSKSVESGWSNGCASGCTFFTTDSSDTLSLTHAFRAIKYEITALFQPTAQTSTEESDRQLHYVTTYPSSDASEVSSIASAECDVPASSSVTKEDDHVAPSPDEPSDYETTENTEAEEGVDITAPLNIIEGSTPTSTNFGEEQEECLMPTMIPTSTALTMTTPPDADTTLTSPQPAPAATDTTSTSPCSLCGEELEDILSIFSASSRVDTEKSKVTDGSRKSAVESNYHQGDDISGTESRVSVERSSAVDAEGPSKSKRTSKIKKSFREGDPNNQMKSVVIYDAKLSNPSILNRARCSDARDDAATISDVVSAGNANATSKHPKKKRGSKIIKCPHAVVAHVVNATKPFETKESRALKHTNPLLAERNFSDSYNVAPNGKSLATE